MTPSPSPRVLLSLQSLSNHILEITSRPYGEANPKVAPTTTYILPGAIRYWEIGPSDSTTFPLLLGFNGELGFLLNGRQAESLIPIIAAATDPSTSDRPLQGEYWREGGGIQ